jgi:hypothetical protein
MNSMQCNQHHLSCFLELVHDIPQTGNSRLTVPQLKAVSYSMIPRKTFRFNVTPIAGRMIRIERTI